MGIASSLLLLLQMTWLLGDGASINLPQGVTAPALAIVDAPERNHFSSFCIQKEKAGLRFHLL